MDVSGNDNREVEYMYTHTHFCVCACQCLDSFYWKKKTNNVLCMFIYFLFDIFCILQIKQLTTHLVML
jgi:hypothetical protein